MAYSFSSPRNSFIQLSESSAITSCNFTTFSLCLPVYEEDDVYFQFIITAGSAEEADQLCDLDNDLITVGLAGSASDDFIIEFSEKPDRYRLSDFQVLYNWSHGLPGFADVVAVGECFVIKIRLSGAEVYTTYEAWSNCLQRIGSDCHTSVIEYGNEDNAFGFYYCNSEAVDAGQEDCDPTFIQFTNQSTLTIPYTASMSAKYGDAPTLKVWIYDTNGELVNMMVRQAFDTYPPTELRFDFGGAATGIIKIS